MFAKCLIAVALCAMLIGSSHQQVVVPAYSAAYVPSAYYPSAYSPYAAYPAYAAYPSVWGWGSNKNKEGETGPEAPRAFSRPSLLNNNQKSA